MKKYFTNVKYNGIINIAGNCVDTILGVKEKKEICRLGQVIENNLVLLMKVVFGT